MFIGHLVLEKTWKAIYVKENQKLAPRIHDLVKIAKSTKVQLSENQLLFLSEATDFNMEGRYPDEKMEFSQQCTKDFTETYLRKIKEFYHWLRQQI